MKNCVDKLTISIRIFLIILLLSSTAMSSYAVPKRVHIIKDTTYGGEDKPVRAPGLDPFDIVSCIADAEAGWAELQFNINVGEVQIEVKDSSGWTEDFVIADTEIQTNITVRLPAMSLGDMCIITITGSNYSGAGYIYM